MDVAFDQAGRDQIVANLDDLRLRAELNSGPMMSVDRRRGDMTISIALASRSPKTVEKSSITSRFSPWFQYEPASATVDVEFGSYLGNVR
jgi:hypothetical protein